MTDLLPGPPSSWRARAAALRDSVPLSPATAAGAVVLLVAVVVIAAAMVRRPPTQPRASVAAGARARATGWTPPTSEPASEGATVVVHVAGAVVHPGLQHLSSGARVGDAIAAAGGVLPDADVDAINLAAKVADGDRVYVPRRGEVVVGAAAAVGPAVAAILDLNTATAEQLDTLPGIGPATAQAIVAYRTEHGRFRSVDGLLAVRGIGPAKLAAIRSRLRV